MRGLQGADHRHPFREVKSLPLTIRSLQRKLQYSEDFIPVNLRIIRSVIVTYFHMLERRSEIVGGASMEAEGRVHTVYES